MKWKYTTKFEAKAKILKQPESEKESFASICTASDLSGLKDLLPSKAEALANRDFLYVTFNLAVINQANINGDAISTAQAVEIAKNVKFRPIDIEHDRSRCIGVMTHAGFSTFGENRLLSEAEASAMDGPFNLAISGIIWRITGSTDSILEECSNPESEHYQAVSASWELGYNEFELFTGSRNINNASIVSEPLVVAESEKYLRSMGGDGFLPTGEEVYRLIKDPVLIGAGLVLEPASAVAGVLVMSTAEEDKQDKLEDDNEKLKALIMNAVETFMSEKAVFAEQKPLEAAASVIKEEKNEESENKISLLENETVNNSIEPMKFNNLQEVFAHIETHKTESLASKEMCDFISAKISEANELYLAEKEAKAEAEAKLAQSISDAEEAKKSLASLNDKIAEMEALAAEKEAQDILDNRLNSLAEVYVLDDPKLRQKLIKEMKDLDDEGYDYWLKNDAQFILASREKEKPKANVEDATAGLKTATASAATDIPNAQNPEQKEKAFSVADLAADIQFKFRNK